MYDARDRGMRIQKQMFPTLQPNTILLAKEQRSAQSVNQGAFFTPLQPSLFYPTKICKTSSRMLSALHDKDCMSCMRTTVLPDLTSFRQGLIETSNMLNGTLECSQSSECCP